MTKIKRNELVLIFGMVSILAFHGRVGAEPDLQAIPTATPVQVSLPTPLPIIPTDSQSGNNGAPSVTRTPTPEGSAILEAITEANVRSQPDPESDRLGTIRAGDTYTVIGRYYRWYEFQYDQSPSSTGWVFDDLVKVTGNTDRIPDLTLGSPTPDANAEANSTLVVLTQTPGGLLTATAGVGVVPLPIESSAGGNSSTNNQAIGSPTPLPTFTAPANLGAIPVPSLSVDGSAIPNTTADSPQNIDIAIPSRIPPILPILVLGGAGILGLIISSFRK